MTSNVSSQRRRSGNAEASESVLTLVGEMLRGASFTVDEAAALMRCRRPTARERIELIGRTLGALSVDRSARAHRYSLALKPSAPDLTPREAEQVLALRACRGLLSACRGSILDEAIATMLESAAPDAADRVPVALDRLVYPLQRTATADALRTAGDILWRALVRGRVLEVRYRLADGTVLDEVIEPLTLVVSSDGLHLYANVIDSPRPDRVNLRRLFNTARFVLLLPGGRFEYPPLDVYDPASIWRWAWGLEIPEIDDGGPIAPPAPLVLRFAPSWRGLLDSQRIHGTAERLPDAADGSPRVSIRVWRTRDFEHWLRGHADSVQLE